MKKLVMITMVASPHQVRFVPFLAKYFDVQHYFYDELGGRQSFWEIELGERCHILPCHFKWRGKYLTFSVLSMLRRERPDILLLGGFSVPSNYLAYLWAKWHHVPVVMMSERSRDHKGNLRGYGLTWRILRFLYRKIDRIMVTDADIVSQFRDTFRFGDKVVAGRYPTDIDRYFSHPVRGRKDAYILIYPNRMTDIYNPIGAIEIFADVLTRYPKTLLKMNAAGELRGMVQKRIEELGIGASVQFLDDIKTWDDLSSVYASCDIMYLPARFSNGNYTIAECRVSGMGCVVSDRILGTFTLEMKAAKAGFVLPLDKKLFVEKICWYIEHPEMFAREATINRAQLRYLTHEETANLYFNLIGEL